MYSVLSCFVFWAEWLLTYGYYDDIVFCPCTVISYFHIFTEKTSVSAYMLAVCLYHLRRLKQAQNLLSDYLHDSQCILLYARCCLELNE